MADTTPPIPTILNLPTIFIGAGDGYSWVQFRAAARDDDSGTKIVTIDLDRPILTNNGPVTSIDFSLHDRFGSVETSVYLQIDPSTLPGLYHVKDVHVADVAGNSATYDEAQLRALGFSTVADIATAAPSDLDFNLRSDILFQNTNGAISAWVAGVTVQNGGRNFQQGTYNDRVDVGWKAVETFDFAGRGASSILWRKADGSVAVWNTVAAQDRFDQNTYYHGPVSNDWKIVGAGDMDGDHRADILWRNDDGSISTWTSLGNSFRENTYFHASVGTNWLVEGLGDFNRDTRSDILWRNVDGSLSIWNSTGAGFQENSWYHAPVGRDWHIDGIGDFNGDGRDDLLWRNDDGRVTVWQATVNGLTEGLFNASAATDWQIIGAADFDGDGLSDILWRRANGDVSVWSSNGTAFVQNTYSSNAATSWTIVAHDFIL